MPVRRYGAPVVERLRPTTRTDSVGDTVTDWRTPQRKTLWNADVQPVNSTEEDGVTVVIVRGRLRLFVPGADVLTAQDRVAIDGVPWKVDGDPQVLRMAVGRPVTLADLVRITG